MRERDLRTVLLVKSVEDADTSGRMLPPADRITAAREAKRQGGDDDRMLAARAEQLLEQLAVRHPVLQGVHALAGGVSWTTAVILILGLLLGGALSALDGTRRIDIIAFPLFALVAWNLVVYVSLFLRAVATPRGESFRYRLLPRLLADATGRGVTAVATRSRAFDALLADAIGRFAGEWLQASKPLLLGRAVRAFHLGAAAVGVGLIAGLYLRGMGLDYQAGWSSTFLDANQAHRIAWVVYGPASSVTGIPIPDATRFAALRWESPDGGEGAARWIHLLAATALLYIVIPRLLLAIAASFAVLRLERRAPRPAWLSTYYRTAFAGVAGSVERGVVLVAPYAYDPEPASLERLRAWLPEVVGASLPIDLRAPVAYGGEQAFLDAFADKGGAVADVVVLVFNMASTPEDENHGTVLSGARDRLARERPDAQLLVAVDESPYAARMGLDSARAAERREAWRRFIEARGLEPRFVQLAQ